METPAEVNTHVGTHNCIRYIDDNGFSSKPSCLSGLYLAPLLTPPWASMNTTGIEVARDILSPSHSPAHFCTKKGTERPAALRRFGSARATHNMSTQTYCTLDGASSRHAFMCLSLVLSGVSGWGPSKRPGFGGH